MKINLDDKVTRFLVQEYVNKICNYTKETDLSWHVYKLIHTFNVVEMAQRLIARTRPCLSKQMQKHILDAALLHDVGRCYEFKDGKRLNVDHGKIGAKLIKENFPNMRIEAQSTLFHNKIPSNKDPKACQPVLDYVRDADMLANLKQQVDDVALWLFHISKNCDKSFLTPVIDKEIFQAAKKSCSVQCERLKTRNLLTMWLWELCWVYNLKTQAGLDYARKEKIFIRFKQMLFKKIIPLTTKDLKKQKKLIQQIQAYFPDALFLK